MDRKLPTESKDNMTWISVEDKLPKDGVFVLCRAGKNLPYVAHYINEIWIDIWDRKYRCTHWMPLPKIPTRAEQPCPVEWKLKAIEAIPWNIESAIRQFMEFGEDTKDKSHNGYYSNGGWPYETLKKWLKKVSIKETVKDK